MVQPFCIPVNPTWDFATQLGSESQGWRTLIFRLASAATVSAPTAARLSTCNKQHRPSHSKRQSCFVFFCSILPPCSSYSPLSECTYPSWVKEERYYWYFHCAKVNSSGIACDQDGNVHVPSLTESHRKGYHPGTIVVARIISWEAGTQDDSFHLFHGPTTLSCWIKGDTGWE